MTDLARDVLTRVANARNGLLRPARSRTLDDLERRGLVITDCERRVWLTSDGLRKLGRPRPRTNRQEHTKPTGQR